MFDKTGTITHGKPSVATVAVFIEEAHLSLARMLAIGMGRHFKVIDNSLTS